MWTRRDRPAVDVPDQSRPAIEKRLWTDHKRSEVGPPLVRCERPGRPTPDLDDRGASSCGPHEIILGTVRSDLDP